MDIMEINPVEFGGAVAHVAAGQVFQILSSTETRDGPQSIDWYGGGDDNDDIPTDIMLFADYVGQTAAGGERLWRWGVISGLVLVGVPASQDYADVPPSRRWAFDMFAAICLQGFTQMLTLQNEEKARQALLAQAEINQPIAIEDSIFEPEGSLGELDKHAPAFFAQVAEGDALRAAAEEAAARVEAENTASQPKPMNIGAMTPGGEANEEVPAGPGQETGNEAAADPDGALPDGTVPAGEPVAASAQGVQSGVLPADAEAGVSDELPLAAAAQPLVTPKKPSRSKSKK